MADGLMSLSCLALSHWKLGLAPPTKEGGSWKWLFPKPDVTVGRTTVKTLAFTTNEMGLPLAAVYRLDIRWAGCKHEGSIISLKPHGMRNEASSV